MHQNSVDEIRQVFMNYLDSYFLERNLDATMIFFIQM